jgi:hypothetical protein
MSSEVHVLPPIAVIYHEEVLASGYLAPAPPLPDVGIDPAQVKEVDQLFDQKNKEADKVASLVGLYISVALLRDLAIDAFTPAPGELEEEELRNKKPRLIPENGEE